MKIVLIIVGAVIAVLGICVAAIIIVGYRLSEAHTVSRSVRIGKPSEEVYGVIRNVGEYPQWRSDVKEVVVLRSDNGTVRFREKGSNGTITYELADRVPGKSMTTTIMDQDLGFTGSWTYELSSGEHGTVVTITEDALVTNPFFRFMSKYVFGHTATIDTYLRSLSKHFGEQALPQNPPD